MSDDVNIKINAQNAASAALRQTGNDAAFLANKLGVLRSSAGSLKGLVSQAIGGFAIGSLIKSSIAAYTEQEDAVKRLESVLSATGGAAELTSVQIQDFATSLQDTTRFADETTIAAASVLATFNKVKGDQFTGALKAAADVATIKGMGLTEVATLIGKALQAPEDGLSRLKRIGIVFDEGLASNVKSLTDLGQAAAAQDLILQEFNKRFGGAAQNDIQTYRGQIEQTKNAFNELQETAGNWILKHASPQVQGALEMNRAKDSQGWFRGLLRFMEAPIGVDAPASDTGPPKIGTPFAVQKLFRAPGTQLDQAAKNAITDPLNRGLRAMEALAFSPKNKLSDSINNPGLINGLKQLTDDLKKRREAVRTPQEIFDEIIKRNTRQLRSGMIDLDLFEREKKAAQKDLQQGLAHEGGAGSYPGYVPAAVGRFLTRGPNVDPALMAQKQIAENTKEANDKLEDLKVGVKGLNDNMAGFMQLVGVDGN